MCGSQCLPEDAEDEDGSEERGEGDAVADGVAHLHLPEEPPLQETADTYKQQKGF